MYIVPSSNSDINTRGCSHAPWDRDAFWTFCRTPGTPLLDCPCGGILRGAWDRSCEPHCIHKWHNSSLAQFGTSSTRFPRPNLEIKRSVRLRVRLTIMQGSFLLRFVLYLLCMYLVPVLTTNKLVMAKAAMRPEETKKRYKRVKTILAKI